MYISSSSRMHHYGVILSVLVRKYMCGILIKGSGCRKQNIEIFVDLNRADYDKSVKKNYGRLTNYIILIILINIITNNINITI